MADQERLLQRLNLLNARLSFPTPGHLAAYLFRKTLQTPALDLLDEALVDTTRPGGAQWLIWTMPPQEGKSQRVSRFFVLWLLIHFPDKRIAIVSYADSLARRWGRDIRNDIREHPELGLAIRADTGAANEWKLDGWEGGMVTAGIGSGLTGRPVDVLIIDDPLKDQKEADSPVSRETCNEFWRTTANSRLGEDCICVLVMTRWHEADLAGYLIERHPEDWKLVNIPAEAEHDPLKGETDILGRKPGEFMLSARLRSLKGWLRRKRNSGVRGWNALYQGRPAPMEGGVFKRHWWRCLPRKAVERGDGTWFVPGADEVIQSWDMTFKDTDGSDYVVCLVLARRGPKVWVVDILRERMEFTETCAAFRMMTAKWPQATRKIVEDKANGPAVISQLRRDIGGIVAFTPVDSKLARARAIAPFVEAGDVALPDPAEFPASAGLIEEAASFPNSAFDDQVDALSQALHQLLLTKPEDIMEEMAREHGVNAPAPEVVSHTAWTPQDEPGESLWG